HTSGDASGRGESLSAARLASWPEGSWEGQADSRELRFPWGLEGISYPRLDHTRADQSFAVAELELEEDRTAAHRASLAHPPRAGVGRRRGGGEQESNEERDRAAQAAGGGGAGVPGGPA